MRCDDINILDRIRGVKENQRRKLISGYWIKIIQWVAVYLTKDYVTIIMYAPTLSHKIGILHTPGFLKLNALRNLTSNRRVKWIALLPGRPCPLCATIFHAATNGCETWPVRVADERMLEVFDNDSIRRILRVRRRDCVPSVELRRRLSLTSIPALLVQSRLRWFGHAARRPEGELIKDLLLPTPPRTWRNRTGGQLKTWATTTKADLEPISGPRVFGHARWRKDWVKVSFAHGL